MKLKSGFVPHDMGGEHVIVPTGENSFAGMVRCNGTAAFIVNCLLEDTTREGVVEAMLAKYDVSAEVAGATVDRIVAQLREIGAIEE
jgi:hypothetical protein